jgi:hemolysin III
MKYYSPLEEKINILSHAAGFLLSFLALILMLVKSSSSGNFLEIISALVFGLSLMILYAASTLYHRSREEKLRARLRIFDHAAIYVLIAGTYTPFTLITLHGNTGWLLFATVWTMALVGVILKLFFTGKFNILSTAMYVGMGWLIIFAIKPLLAALPSEGLNYLFAGGAFYTIGALFYAFKNRNFTHATFHIFVLLGSFCHFMAVYFYVL